VGGKGVFGLGIGSAGVRGGRRGGVGSEIYTKGLRGMGGGSWEKRARKREVSRREEGVVGICGGGY